MAIYSLYNPYIIEITKKSNSSVQLRWSKRSKSDGYEIYMYDEKAKEYKLIKTIKDNNTVTYKIPNLKTGKVYKFKIRSYKIIDGVTYYSAFSDVTKIKM